MSDSAVEAPAEQSQENLTPEYIQRTISAAIPESDLKYLGDEAPEPAVEPEKKTKKAPAEKPEKTEKTEKPEIGDSEIPLDDEPEKAVDDDDDDDDQPPEARTETDRAKSDAKWKQYREAYRENPRLKSENQTLKAQLAKAGDTSEVTTLREHVQALANERARLIGLVEQGNIEHSEIWDQQIMAPLNAMWEDIQVISKRNGMEATELAKLLQNKDGKVLNAYMEEHDIDPGDRHYLFGMMRDIDRIDRQKAHLRNHAHELTQQSQQQMLSQRDQHFRGLGEARTQAVQTIAPKIEQRILAILPKDKRRNLQNDFKHILDFEHWQPDVQMYAGLAAVVLPDLLDSYNLLRSKLKDANGELVKFRGGTPKIGGGRPTPSRPALEDTEEQPPAALAKTNLTDFAEDGTRRIRQALGYRK